MKAPERSLLDFLQGQTEVELSSNENLSIRGQAALRPCKHRLERQPQRRLHFRWNGEQIRLDTSRQIERSVVKTKLTAD